MLQAAPVGQLSRQPSGPGLGAQQGSHQQQPQHGQQYVGAAYQPHPHRKQPSQQHRRQQQQWYVLLDAAKACASHPPDLSAAPADLVALSFYKIFGYPTGLGALLVRRPLLQLMAQHKRYFGGGTVQVGSWLGVLRCMPA
jgi:hypothetical protein